MSLYSVGTKGQFPFRLSECHTLILLLERRRAYVPQYLVHSGEMLKKKDLSLLNIAFETYTSGAAAEENRQFHVIN